MAKKRKTDKTFAQPQSAKQVRYNEEERFDDSEDDFYTGRDKILLDDSKTTRRQRRLEEQEKDLQPSDEEVLSYEDDESDSDTGEDGGSDDADTAVRQDRTQVNNGDQDEDSEEETWGTNRADYYNADKIETEADALDEEVEAKRLYQKQLKGMKPSDFGFDELEWAQETTKQKTRGAVVEKLPEAQLPENATTAQLDEMLQSRYPELKPLADDFAVLQEKLWSYDEELQAVQAKLVDGEVLGSGIPLQTKRNALAAYLSAISMYFAILTLKAERTNTQRHITALAPVELHEHPLIVSLSKARQLWDRVQDLPEAFPVPKSQPTVAVVNAPAVQEPEPRSTVHEKPKKTKAKVVSPETGIFAGLDGIKLNSADSPPTVTKSKKQLVDLQALIEQSQDAGENVSDDSDLGDERPLTTEEAAEKTRKRKSLRFYSSQIAQKAQKRGAASREAGGDDDLPHKERQRDRRERLLKEAESRGRKSAEGAEALSDGDAEHDHDNGPREHRAEDEYYDTLVNVSKTKKADKRARADAYAEAARQGAEAYEEETVGADGKRAITYAIAKNKGLAPRRKKEVRNPRVKKKKRYEDKLKKLGSMRAVYKGGEGRGGYGGELTGIKSNLVKSVKLS